MNGTTIRARPLLSHGRVHLIIALLGAVTGAAAISHLIVVEKFRFAIAVTISLLLIALSVVNLRMGIVGTLVYLVFMGDIRRMLIPSVGWSGEDPLLLIGPIFACIVFAYAWSSRSIQINTPLAGWILGLMAIMMLQMLNPRQGGLIVGVAGALFFIVPLLWYWIGRTYATPSFVHTLLFRIVVPLAVLAAGFGLYQVFYGYLPYQEMWYEIAGYTALDSRGIEAPISFFASTAEYVNFVLSALAVLIAVLVHRRQYGVLLLIVPLFLAVFLAGSRGPIAKLLVTAVGMWAVLGTNVTTWVVRGLLALVLGVLGLTWSLSSLEIEGGNERVQYRIERQRQGFLEATEQGSSAHTHLFLMMRGYKHSFQQPLGAGLGATTEAAAKYSGRGGSTEVDSSDVFVSTGLVGGIIYLFIIFLIIRSAFQYWARTRSLLSLCIAGVLAINFFLWLRGGQYAVSSLIWFLVGALDRFENMPSENTEGKDAEAEDTGAEDTEPALTS